MKHFLKVTPGVSGFMPGSAGFQSQVLLTADTRENPNRSEEPVFVIEMRLVSKEQEKWQTPGT